MRLVSVALKNFRCYKEEKRIEFGDLTTLIGRNDIGKSTILEALEIFFNNNGIVKIDNSDCTVACDENMVEITCEFSDLPQTLILDTQAETSLADEYLLTENGFLKVKKIFKCTGAKPKEEIFVCAHHPVNEKYHDLLELNNSGLKNRLRELGIDEKNVLLNNNASIRQAIWKSCKGLKFQEVSIPVAREDGKRIWDNLKSYLPIFALFQSDRPSRDSDAEIQDPMKLAIATALAEPVIQQKLNEVVDAVKLKAVELADRTHRALQKIDPTLAAELTPEFKADQKWANLFNLSLNSDNGIPVNKRGSGVRRLILVSFFRAESERRRTENDANNIIYAIEEPETSQHPANQRILLESFQDLAAEPGCQVILTTHSPGFANYLPIDSFRYIKRNNNGQPVIEYATDSTWQEIAQTLGVVPDNRVRILLCVEGPTDVLAMQYLSKALHNSDPTIPDLSSDPRVAFVVLGGGALIHWVNNHYLKGLNRPEVHIYDNDVSKYGQLIQEINKRTDGSWGVLTHKLEIENYLHPDALTDAFGISISFGDQDDVPKLVGDRQKWNSNTAKKKIANSAFPRMTADRIKKRDPHGELEGWFRRIGGMLTW
jgi:energy-coupling factor transporter ATP-binding protein EcfA2